jgi:methionine sulfoxide reductase heme-binding subunit
MGTVAAGLRCRAVEHTVALRGQQMDPRNRRYLGVSLFFSQLFHGTFILSLMALDPGRFKANVASSTIVGGLIGYLFLALMTATSFERSAACIGRQAWSALHTAGIYYVWIVFAFTYLGRTIQSPIHAVFFVPLIAALAIRVLRWRRLRVLVSAH